MKITEDQIKAIIEDATSQLLAVIDEPCDCSDLQCEEDEYGRCYPYCSGYLEGDLEEICIDGLAGIEDGDVCIYATYDGSYSYHDDYDPGDYWTPPSGGWELDDCEAYLTSITIELSVYNPTTDEYEDVEVSQEVCDRIIEEVNKNVGYKAPQKKVV